MKRSTLVALALLLFLATPVAAANQGGCVIDPNPVVYGSTFTITAQLDPLKAYDIRIDQDDHFGHHDDASGIYADADGKWSWTYNLWGHPRDGLDIGGFAVHVKPSSEVLRADKGNGGAVCDGEVVP